MNPGPLVLLCWWGALPLAGCAQGAAPPRPPADVVRIDDGERGATVQLAPTTLMVGLLVNGADADLRDGRIVHSGDRLQITVQPEEDLHVYLGYCSTKGRLSWFPERGALMARAGVPLVAPAERGAIVLDDQVGRETLYVVVSQRELSQADQELASAIERYKQGSAEPDCATPFDRPPARPPIHKRPARPGRAPTKAAPRATTAATTTSATNQWSGSPARAQPEETAAAMERPDPTVGMVRGDSLRSDNLQQLTLSVDASGIAILRTRFQHAARPP